MDLADDKSKKQQYLQSWDMPWQELEVLIGGKSSIDLPRMSVKDFDEASAFVCNYGYDPSSDNDMRLIQAVLIEAINFIEQHLLIQDRHKTPIPDELINCEDIRQVILWASVHSQTPTALKLWSCAVLRVVHTIAHIEGVQRRVAVDTASNQIMKRFADHVFSDGEQNLWLGDRNDRVQLQRIEWKNGKSRESLILKLLHKKANVAETIFDMLGVRIVTKRLCDVVMVVKYLRQFYMITFANCNPGRARNNLIDMETFHRNTDMLRQMLEADKIDADEFNNLMEQMTLPAQANTGTAVNPHSISTYKAVQLTCRQLIRSHNPMFGWLDKLEQWQHLHTDDEIGRLLNYIRDWPGVSEDRDVAVFFPFEVQVMDEATYLANQYGDASHDLYKQSQLRAARRRVLGDVLKFIESESISN